MAAAREPWWVIGSAAAALHGIDPGGVADVDVLLAAADAERLLPALGLPLRPGQPDDRFRSARFARWTVPPLPVEFMAGLEVRQPGAWTAVAPLTRLSRAGVFVPDRRELAAILHRFGRDKDRRRAALLGGGAITVAAASTRSAGPHRAPATRR